jgi:fatty-acyl-CoA synthase
VDDDMNDVPKDGETMGEIVARGNTVMKGYFNDEEETQEAFEGGWFHTEDLGVWHPNGDVEVRDRDKDVIISGGENISSVEVEQVIEEHPAVMEAAVISMPDEQWGERPKAFVTLNEGEEATEEEIIDFCKENIARFKAPEAVEFGELPKTATGKIQKYVLREQEWEGQEKRVG